MDDYQRYNKSDKARTAADADRSPGAERTRKVLSLIDEIDMDRRDVPPNLALATDNPDISLLEDEGCDPYNSGSYRKPKI